MTTDVDEFEIDPRIEKIVWRGLGVKSLKAIAEETGLSRDQIIRIREELLSSVDELTITQKRQKLLIELESLAYEARDRAKNMDDEFFSGSMNSAISAIKAVQAELARMSKSDDSKIEALNTLRRREIVRMYTSIVNEGVSDISEKYGIPEDEMFEVFNKLLADYARRSEAEGL